MHTEPARHSGSAAQGKGHSAGPVPAQRKANSLDLLRDRIERHLEINLECPDLTVTSLARRMGCSPRYVQRAFEEEGTTPSEYIREARLRRALSRLLSPDGASCSISEIAFSVGFSSSAHFSRAFRSRFNITPSTLRRTTAARQLMHGLIDA